MSREYQSGAATVSESGTRQYQAGAEVLSEAVSTGISGTASLTLDALTLSSAGTLPVTGALSATLGALTLSATGTHPAAGTIAITAPTSYRVYQRSGGAATVTVSGTYTGSPVDVEVRVDAGAWATLQTGPTGGTYSGTVSVSEGTRSISVRFSNDTATTATVTNVLVGDVFLVIGQSNAAGRLTNDQSYTHASQKAGMWKGGAWGELDDPTEAGIGGITDGSPWPLLATLHMADQGVPFGVLNYAVGGTAISNWWTTSAQAQWTAAKAAVTASGVNGVAAVLWDQGETDAINGLAEATYNSRLDGLAGDVASAYGCKLVVAQVGTTTGIPSDSALDAIRSAQVTAWGDNASVKPGPLGYDRAGLHWLTDAEGLVLARRWWFAIDETLFGGTTGRGPRVQSAIFNTARDQVTVGFDLDLKTGLTHATAAWAVADGGGAVAVSSVAYHGSNPKKLVLTLGAAAAGATTVSLGSGNAAAGLVVPLGPDLMNPTSGSTNLPAEPFAAQAVSDAALAADLSVTLGALTLTAAGTLPVAGTLSGTFGALTLTAAGTLPITGALSATLGALTLSAAGVLASGPIAGAIDATLGALTLSATGTLPITGALSATLGALTLEAYQSPLAAVRTLTIDVTHTFGPVGYPRSPSAAVVRGRVHQGEKGMGLRFRFVGDGEIVDISDAQTTEVWYLKAGGTWTLLSTGFVTDGTDGLIEHVFVAAELDELGVTKVQGFVETPTWSKWSNVEAFFIEANKPT